MMRSKWVFLCALSAAATVASACANGQPVSTVLAKLPAQQRTAIEQAVQNGSYVHLPAWLPFTPTHGTVSKVDLLGLPPQTTYTISLYNDSELLTIKEPFEALKVYNNPQGLHLDNGVPATFHVSAKQSLLCWATGPNLAYTLYSQKISGGSVHATAGPGLTESQLVKIAESFPAR